MTQSHKKYAVFIVLFNLMRQQQQQVCWWGAGNVLISVAALELV